MSVATKASIEGSSFFMASGWARGWPLFWLKFKCVDVDEKVRIVSVLAIVDGATDWPVDAPLSPCLSDPFPVTLPDGHPKKVGVGSRCQLGSGSA